MSDAIAHTGTQRAPTRQSPWAAVTAVPLASLFCVLLLVCGGAVGAREQSPNFLLLMAEDLSPRVGAFGDAVAQTPHIDRLAADGVRYPNTFTTAGVCAPSRAAHILGMYQIATGTQHMRTTRGPLGSYRSVPPPAAKAYPELLRGAGYYTFTDRKLDYQFSGPMAGSGPFTIWDAEGGDGFAAWRRRAPGQPFYGLVNFAVTHESGVFPPLGNRPRGLMHLATQVLRAAGAPDAPEMSATDPARIALPPYYPDTPTVRADLARHYDNIAIMDWQVGQVLAALEADGLLDSTVVIWTADHGDGLPRAKRELFDSGIRVPMIIRWPAAFRPEGVAPGVEEARLVSFVDLAPTILRLAGVTVPAHLQGRDLVNAPPRAYVFAARDRIDEVPDRQRAVRDARYKYIRSWYPDLPGGHPLAFRDNIAMVREMRAMYQAGKLDADQRRWFEPVGQERLFDTLEDPFELRDLSGDYEHRAVLARMRAALDQWLARTGDWSEHPEAQMLAAFNPAGEVPVTPNPVLARAAGGVSISAAAGASIGYRVGAGPWRVYTGPVAVPGGQRITAKAVRYGWRESDSVRLEVP